MQEKKRESDLGNYRFIYMIPTARKALEYKLK